MAAPNRFESIDEHIAQVSELGLSALVDSSLEATSTHIAGGFIRTEFIFTEDTRIAGPTTGRRDVPFPIFRIGRARSVVITAATFVGKALFEPSPPTSIVGFTLASAADAVDDLHSPTDSLVTSGTNTLYPIALYTQGTEGVVSFSTMYLNIVFVALAPSNGATILKGTKLVVIWLPINT